MSKHLVGTCLLLASLAACKSGPDPMIRTNIGAKLDSAKPAITECYQSSLTTNRKLVGMYVAQMTVDEQGQFTNVSLRRDEPNDPVLRFCVVQTLAKLRLDKPPGAKINLESVPIKFEWANP